MNCFQNETKNLLLRCKLLFDEDIFTRTRTQHQQSIKCVKIDGSKEYAFLELELATEIFKIIIIGVCDQELSPKFDLILNITPGRISSVFRLNSQCSIEAPVKANFLPFSIFNGLFRCSRHYILPKFWRTFDFSQL